MIERRNYEEWEKDGAKTMRQRAQEKTLKILETHRPEPLSDDVQRRIDEIVKEAEGLV